MSVGNPSCRISSHGAVFASYPLTPSAAGVRFFVEKVPLPPVATQAGPIFLSLSHRSCLKAFCSQSESPPPLPSADEEKLRTVSYLVTTCGISLDAALRATTGATKTAVRARNRERVPPVVQLFRSYGFSDAQINKIAAQRPHLLVASPEKTLKPKLEFLLSEGISMKEAADVFASNPTLLVRGLETGIVETYRFLSATLPSRSEVIKVMKYNTQFLTASHEAKLKILRDYGIPERGIFHLLSGYPLTLMRKPEVIEEGIKALLEMGMDPGASKFCPALYVKSSLSKEAWLSKFKLFQEMGMSESEVVNLFKKNPRVFSLTDEMLRHKFDFLKKNLDQEFILRNPGLLLCSIKRKIHPRVSVLKVLMSRGLIREKWLLVYFEKPEACFFEKYVKSYVGQVPDIVKMYKDLCRS